MAPDSRLETAALKLCRQALCRPHPDTATAVAPGLTSDEIPGAGATLSHVDWMLPELAGLIASHHNYAPHDFADLARRFVDEHTFIEDAGDPVFDPRINDQTQQLVEVSVRVQRAIHHHAAAKASHHELQVPPLMCG